MSYAVQVEGTGQPVLLLHGFTGSGNTWSGMADLFSCCAVMPDLPGHGQTKQLPADIETEAAALVGMMQAKGWQTFHVAGYSMGGRLALAIALLFPEAVRSLVLESASPGLKTEQERAARRKADEQLAVQIEKNGLAAFVEKWENIPLFQTQRHLPDPIRQSIRAERLSQSPAGLAASLRMMGTGSQPSYWDQLPHLLMPVLLITGTRDQKFTEIAAHMHRLIPKSEWVQFSGAGHAIHVEQREKFGTIVKTFLFKKGGNSNGF